MQETNLQTKIGVMLLQIFFNNINDTAELISYAASDPELRKVLERTIHVYGNALKDIFKIAKPTIHELTDTFWETVDNMGVKSARGAVNATIDTISAAVAEVPGLGGAVDAVIALGKWFNAVNSGIIAPTITLNGEMTGRGIKTVRDTLAYTKHQGEELAKTYNEFNNMMDDAKKLKIIYNQPTTMLQICPVEIIVKQIKHYVVYVLL